MRIGKILLAVVFSLLVVSCVAQPATATRKKLDSLAHLLAAAGIKPDTNTALLYYHLAKASRDLSIDSLAVHYASKGIALSRELGYKRGQAMCLEILGLQNWLVYQKSVEYFLASLQIFEQINDVRHMASVNREVAGVYYTIGKFQTALEYFLKAKEYSERSGDSAATAANCHSIGGTYAEMGKHRESLEYEQQALKYWKNANDSARIALTYQNMANSYAALKQYNTALAYSYSALRMYKTTDTRNSFSIATIRHDLGYIHYLVATDSTATIHADSLLPAGRQANLDKALHFISEAITIYRNDFVPLFALKRYSDALSLAGRYSEALTYYRQYSARRESELSNDVQLKIAAQETKREADLKEKQIQINRIEMRNSWRERIFFAIGVGLLGVVIASVYRSYAAQKKAKKEQEATNALLAESLAQKEMLMKEIHHRVKNNLQVIGALLDLQLANIADVNAREAITESTTRLKSISLIHQQLYQDEHIAAIEFSQFATDLHKQVAVVFLRAGQQVLLHNRIPEMLLDIDTAVPLGLILNELITNSYKYAFGNDSGNIALDIQKSADNYTLTYADSGPGLPVNMDIRMSKTLGMKLMNRLSRQLMGAFTYTASTNSFIITFKDMAGRKMVD